DVECGGDLGMQAGGDLVRPDGLDRVAYLYPALVEAPAPRPAGGGRGVGGAPPAAPPPPAPPPAPAPARPPPPEPRPVTPRGQRRQRLGRVPGFVKAADVMGGTGTLDQVDLLLGPACPPHGQPAWHQVVPAVSTGHLYHVAGGAQAGDFLGEDELHRCATHRVDPLPWPSAGCWCTAASPSHGRS